jgi:NAD(P)-dependent dehydrogenase (short-subunit alcohol dehydrogenase family)
MQNGRGAASMLPPRKPWPGRRMPQAETACEPLAGRTAMVTGASRGIGRRIALRLADAGADVALTARTEAALATAGDEVAQRGRKAMILPADLRRHEDIALLARAVEREAGALDVLVCNSGVAGPTAPLWEITPEAWGETFAVNETAVFLLCRAFLPGMLARGTGSVVIVGSASGKRPLPLRTPYAASKAALIGLVRSLAWEAGSSGVRVNLVSPGPVAGERLDAVIEGQSAARGIAPEEVRAAMMADSPLQRLSTAENIAEAVVFLAGDHASAITGEDLNVSSGWVMHG